MSIQGIRTEIYYFQELNIQLLYKILQLRSEVFVVEQNCVYQDMDDKDQQAYHLCLIKKEELIGTCRILDKGISYPKHASIGRVVIAASHRHLGLGYDLMQQALETCKMRYPSTPIKISAQSHLQAFYTRLGVEAVGFPYLEDGIPHIAMIAPA